MVNFGGKKKKNTQLKTFGREFVDCWLSMVVESWTVKLTQLKKKGSEILKEEEVLRNGELETGFKSLEEEEGEWVLTE